MTLKFYISMVKELKLKVRKFSGLIPTFVEVTGEKLVGGLLLPRPPTLNRVNDLTEGFSTNEKLLADDTFLLHMTLKICK